VITKAVILAAGVGTRMRPLTLRRPKPLVPVAGRPLIEHIIGGLAAGGFTEIGLVVGYMQDLIRERLGDGRRLGARIEYIVQEEPAGTGAATLLAEEFVDGQRFFLGWGDIMVPPKSYREIAEICERENPDGLLTVNYVEDPWEGAAVYVSDEGQVERIVEKPPKGTATTNCNNSGLFVLGPELIEMLKTTAPSERGEVEVPSAIDAMLVSGKRMRAYEIDGYWSDVARPSTALHVSGEMIAAASRDGVIIHPDARVAPAARLVGPVRIGAGARVDGGTLGPNVTVMERATVGAGAKLTDACLYPDSRVGRGCELEWAIVEEGVQVADGVALKGSAEQAAVEEGN
jgi:NDP-sugar pyrophosphorylase family protein